MSAALGRPLTYREWWGLWLNRKRAQYRRAWEVCYGSAIAAGQLEPNMEYFRANSDGEGEALLLKAQQGARGQ